MAGAAAGRPMRNCLLSKRSERSTAEEDVRNIWLRRRYGFGAANGFGWTQAARVSRLRFVGHRRPRVSAKPHAAARRKTRGQDRPGQPGLAGLTRGTGAYALGDPR